MSQPQDAVHTNLLDEAYSALDSGDLALARQKHAALAQHSPKHRDALMLESELLELSGLGEEALAVLEEDEHKLRQDLVLGFRYATLLLDVYDDVMGARPIIEDVYERLGKGESPLLHEAQSEDDHAEIAGFKLELLLALSDCRAALSDAYGALELAIEAAKMAPDDAHAQITLANAHFDLCEIDDAEAVLKKALNIESDLPDAFYLQARMLTSQNKHDEADELFQKANALAGERFALPFRRSAADFEKDIEGAFSQMPKGLAAYLKKTSLSVRDLPELGALKENDPPLSPSALGHYEGDAPKREGAISLDVVPSAIALFRKNFEITASDADEMRELIHTTLLHEVVHFLDLEEDDLAELGFSEEG